MNNALISYPKNGVYYREDPFLQNKANKIISYFKQQYKIDPSIQTEIEIKYFEKFKGGYDVLPDINKFFNGEHNQIVSIDKVKEFIDFIYYDCIPDFDIPFSASFIVFEGCDGVGKDYILDKLDLSKYDIMNTREPGGPEISEMIRNIILDNNHKNTMSYRTEFLLYCASRAQHVDQIIIPALEAGTNVISNRYYHSSLIYQKLRGLDDFYLKTITEFAINDTHPDMVFSLYNNDDIIIERLNNKSKDRLEDEPNEFFSNINTEYKNIDKNKLIKSISNSKYTIYVPIDTSSSKAMDIVNTRLINVLL